MEISRLFALLAQSLEMAGDSQAAACVCFVASLHFYDRADFLQEAAAFLHERFEWASEQAKQEEEAEARNGVKSANTQPGGPT